MAGPTRPHVPVQRAAGPGKAGGLCGRALPGLARTVRGRPGPRHQGQLQTHPPAPALAQAQNHHHRWDSASCVAVCLFVCLSVTCLAQAQNHHHRWDSASRVSVYMSPARVQAQTHHYRWDSTSCASVVCHLPLSKPKLTITGEIQLHVTYLFVCHLPFYEPNITITVEIQLHVYLFVCLL